MKNLFWYAFILNIAFAYRNQIYFYEVFNKPNLRAFKIIVFFHLQNRFETMGKITYFNNIKESVSKGN